MKIACDLDDCLVATCKEVLALVNKRTGNCFKMEELTEFGIENRFNVGVSDVVAAVQEVLLRDSIPQIEEAIVALNWLYRLDAWEDFFIVTHRRIDNLKNTKKLVKSLDLDFDFKLDLVGKNERGVPAKAEYIKDRNIDIMIEDRFDTSVDIALNTEACVLLIDKPWNVEKVIPYGLSDKIMRFDKWLEIADFIYELKMLDNILGETNEQE